MFFLFFTTGCAINQVIQPVNCDKDTKCASQLITQCSPGTFIVGIGNAEAKFTVEGRKANECKVEWGFLNSGSLLSGLTMSCTIPSTITNANEVSNYLFNDKYQGCSGVLKDKIVKPTTEAFPELHKEPATCTDTECANKLLASCGKGSFTTKTADGAELKFSVQTKTATGCIVDAQFTSNPNQNLVGPKMRCIFSVAIHTVADVNNLIKNKFVVSDGYSSTNVCSGELYKLLK